MVIQDQNLCRITSSEKEALLAELSHWDIVDRVEGGRELHRLYRFDSFDKAFEFMRRAVDEIIVKQDHHPRWQNNYRAVEVWVCTAELSHDLTHRDALFARSIEALWRHSR